MTALSSTDAQQGGPGHHAAASRSTWLRDWADVVPAANGTVWLERDALGDATPALLAPAGTDTPWAPRTVPAASRSACTAFLDGIQRSRVCAWVRGVPIIESVVGATVRMRRDRRFVDGGTHARRLVLAPSACVPEAVHAHMARAGVEFVPVEVSAEDSHPDVARAAAMALVSAARATLERQLAEEWLRTAGADHRLVLDGGLGISETVATSRQVIGVVKSHGTLYASGTAREVVFGLRPGERTTVAPHRRGVRGPEVATWYLRLRAPLGGDPLFGLVRVEQAIAGGAGETEARADEWAAWLLLERQPVALPDPRWDRLLYGVAACERYLTARLGY
ncbi:MAG: hypothetical protein MUF00_14695 [Gemmatimonadaceae bacterium]|nr:hypothetical protein [Gemmatimonadaceae bacterium]